MCAPVRTADIVNAVYYDLGLSITVEVNRLGGKTFSQALDRKLVLRFKLVLINLIFEQLLNNFIRYFNFSSVLRLG